MEKRGRKKNTKLTELFVLGFTLLGLGLILVDIVRSLMALGS